MSETVEKPTHEKKSIKAMLRSARDRLRGGDITPRNLGLSTALGLFVGCSPLYGLHSIIAGGLAFLLRLDVLVTYLASNISLPPVIPVLVFAEVQVGAFLLRGHFLPLRLEELAPERAIELGGALFVGAGVVGGTIACVGGVSTYAIARVLEKRRERSTP